MIDVPRVNTMAPKIIPNCPNNIRISLKLRIITPKEPRCVQVHNVYKALMDSKTKAAGGRVSKARRPWNLPVCSLILVVITIWHGTNDEI